MKMKIYPVEVLFWTNDFGVSLELKLVFDDFCLPMYLRWFDLASGNVGCVYPTSIRFLIVFCEISNLKVDLEEFLCWFFVSYNNIGNEVYAGTKFLLMNVCWISDLIWFMNFLDSIIGLNRFLMSDQLMIMKLMAFGCLDFKGCSCYFKDPVSFGFLKTLGIKSVPWMILSPLVVEEYNYGLFGAGYAAIRKEVLGAIVIALSTSFGSSKGFGRGSSMLREFLLVDVCNMEMAETASLVKVQIRAVLLSSLLYSFFLIVANLHSRHFCYLINGVLSRALW
ncbi:hypothetical protein MA16_Dca023562 [Dendrobium catenatum]|uniref:Uncharacterized protein n=1 Tax=Dendrobium catenatum TaxID=906689 RepID=A0A2I0V7H2_9ASPA|nr:hypothetical protein MA16_Dca023562 [Dendrobium catenatum]